MKPSEIRKILTLAKSLGVKELELAGLRVSFKERRAKPSHSISEPLSFSPQSVSVLPAETEDAIEHRREPTELTSEMIPTDEEFLLMSTGFYDALQEEKAMKAEELANQVQ